MGKLYLLSVFRIIYENYSFIQNYIIANFSIIAVFHDCFFLIPDLKKTVLTLFPGSCK